MEKLIITVISSMLMFCFTNLQALTFPLPGPGIDVVGKVQHTRLSAGQALTDVVRKYDLGYYELLEANPKLNPVYLPHGLPLTLPTRYVLPDAPRKGIIINLAELRLYYYPKDSQEVITMPIGIGRQGWDTPTGAFKIIQKKKDPAWHVPKSVAEDMAQYGTVLPKVVPPGPNNPLGKYAMRLSLPSYLIHGTTVPEGVGRRVSAGCIRMFPEDIKSLFTMVPVGTPVKIINQPYKLGYDGKQLVMESHKPLSEMRHQYSDNLQAIWVDAIDNFIAAQKIPTVIDWGRVDSVARAQMGFPAAIGYKQG